MTSDNHPFTPSRAQVYQWWEEACKRPPSPYYAKLDYLATKAAQHGAELAAEQAARKSKPKSLAEEALEALKAEGDALVVTSLWPVEVLETRKRFDIIRRALEHLQELEGNQ